MLKCYPDFLLFLVSEHSKNELHFHSIFTYTDSETLKKFVFQDSHLLFLTNQHYHPYTISSVTLFHSYIMDFMRDNLILGLLIIQYDEMETLNFKVHELSIVSFHPLFHLIFIILVLVFKTFNQIKNFLTATRFNYLQ